MRVLIVGCGYVGIPLGVALRAAGYEVFGLRRNPEAEADLNAAGIVPVFADITEPDSLTALPGGVDWVVHCAAAGGTGPGGYRRVYVDGMRHLLAWLDTARATGLSRFVYTSSTSVYGQNDGAWVTEESPTQPGAPTARVLVEAEQVLLNAYRDVGVPAIVLRLAGIYGPGRGYWFKQVLGGQARLEGEGRRFLNMIHRDDVAGAIHAALERGKPGEIYNVVDNEPVSQRDLYGWLSEMLHRPMPPSVPANESRRTRGATNKRVANAKLREQLGYRLKFPTFREGFEALRRP